MQYIFFSYFICNIVKFPVQRCLSLCNTGGFLYGFLYFSMKDLRRMELSEEVICFPILQLQYLLMILIRVFIHLILTVFYVVPVILSISLSFLACLKFLLFLRSLNLLVFHQLSTVISNTLKYADDIFKKIFSCDEIVVSIIL